MKNTGKIPIQLESTWNDINDYGSFSSKAILHYVIFALKYTRK